MQHLSLDERYHIYDGLKAGKSITAIANELGRSKSTVSEELSRNKGQRGYRPDQATRKACERWAESHGGARKMTGDFLTRIERDIRQDWSPEQIAGRLALEGISIHHETIYRYIYDDKANGGDLHTHLRRGNKVYRKRYGSKDKRGKIKNRVDIDHRPDVANERGAVGHWEGDTVKDTPNNRSIVTLVDRKSRLTITASVDSLHADVVARAIIAVLTPLAAWVQTLTMDNGREFAHHELFGAKLDADVFFAKPYHSWERGTNENTNGLLRQYFPKRKVLFDPENLSLLEVEQRLNTRPRKCLGYLTPCEAFERETGSDLIYC